MSEIESESGEPKKVVEAIIRREISICAVCKDDISTNLGRRRILFHFGDQTRADPTTEVVKQMHDMMSLFANGVNGRQCDLTNCTQTFIESLSAKWCCRKCERMVGSIYKKFQDLQQFYNQFKECPLSTLLNTLSINNTQCLQINNGSDDVITIHGVIIQETELNEECDQITQKSANETNETEAQKSPKKRKLSDNDLQKDENREEEQMSPKVESQRKTRSQTLSVNRSPETPIPKTIKKNKTTVDIKEKKNKQKDNKEEKKEEKVELMVKEETKKETTIEKVIEQELKPKLSSTDNQILSSLYSQYYEGILRAMLTDNKLRTIAITEVAKFISRECLSASTDVAKMSHSIETLKMSEYKKLIQTSLSSTLLLFSAIIGKEKLLNPPIVSIISILIYVLNSHANLFQKMIATVLLNAKCNPSTIEKLHSYKICIAYETLVSFIDNNIDLLQIPKVIKAFQLT